MNSSCYQNMGSINQYDNMCCTVFVGCKLVWQAASLLLLLLAVNYYINPGMM